MSESDYQLAVLNRLARIESLLTGDNTPERGVVVRLDRLEQAEAKRNKWFTIIVGAVLTQTTLGAAGILYAVAKLVL